jgi:hypothetical protein
MISLIELTEFLGWAAVLNIALLSISSIMLMLMKNWITSIHSKMFNIPESELPVIYFKYLGDYKLLIWVFSLIPYLALKCMGQ